MDIKSLEKSLLEIVEKRNELAALDYSDEAYDQIEEELHDLEDDFVDEYGAEIEGILDDIHEEIKSDTDVLLATAYLAKSYKKTPTGYQISTNEGVIIDSEKYPKNKLHLVINPQPFSFVLVIDNKEKKVLWPK
ncbi:MAG TPA: hypothetical protein VL947_05725 [Cytophagales bacterium]|nr:hypothetical protein [Cytophagales bacterium]